MPSMGRPGANAGMNENASWALPQSNFAVWNPTGGNDANTGSLADPVKTLASALSKITTGGTIVVRGGVHSGQDVGYRIANAAGYNAGLGYGGLNVSKQCTIQPYPGETVIFDGTRDESSGWTAGSGYWSKPVTITIDRGATDQYGKLDNDSRGFGWLWVRSAAWRTMAMNSGLNSQQAEAFPLASWNEQVWIDDVRQEQVATLQEVVPGKFYVTGTSGGTNNVMFTSGTYYIGTNPTGKTVRIGELSTSLRLGVAGSTLRGITFRRFCGSNHMGGVVKATTANATFEHIKVEHCSSTAFDLYQSDNSVFRNCEAQWAGNLGFRFGGNSYNLTFDKCKAQYCNSRRYNWSPVSGGLKGTVGRDILIKDSDFTHNWTKGVWFDVSCYNTNVINCALDDNEENGAVFEIGAKALVANCTITNTGTHGIVVLNNNDVRIWNCTFSNSGALRNQVYEGNSPRHLKVYSDDRRLVDSPPGGPGQGEYPNYGRDSRQPVGDPTMNNWLIESFEMKNCVLATGNLQFAYLPIEDLQKNSSRSRNWTEYNIASNGNLYNRLATNNPSWAFLLPGAGTAQTIVFNLANWRTITSQDLGSAEVTGQSVCDATGQLTAPNKALYAKGGSQCPAVALPADVALAIGVPVGDRHVGAYI